MNSFARPPARVFCPWPSPPQVSHLIGRKLGVALCGLGNYARGQLGPALKLTQNCELCGVVTGSPEKGGAWAKEYGFPQNIYHYDTMARLVENLTLISSTSSRRTPCMRSM